MWLQQGWPLGVVVEVGNEQMLLKQWKHLIRCARGLILQGQPLVEEQL
jgi:hypothetical protein